MRFYRQLLLPVLFAFTNAIAANGSTYLELAESNAVAIQTESAEYRFCTEVVIRLAALRRGLKNRHHLDRDDSMLFLFDPPRQVQFWMKDTYIPLDMLFIGPDGRIVAIAERTQPHSLEPVGPVTPVRGVLEINGGLSRKLNIQTGDRIVRTSGNDCRMTTREE